MLVSQLGNGLLTNIPCLAQDTVETLIQTDLPQRLRMHSAAHNMRAAAGSILDTMRFRRNRKPTPPIAARALKSEA
jgi:hypothetical protein